MPVTFLDHKCIKIESNRLIASTVKQNNQASNATDDETCANSVYVHKDASFNKDLEDRSGEELIQQSTNSCFCKQ